MEVATKRTPIALMHIRLNAKAVPSVLRKPLKVAAKAARKAKMVEKEASRVKPAKVAKTHQVVEAKRAAKRESPERAVEKGRPTTNSKAQTRLHVKAMHGGTIVSESTLEHVRIPIAFQVDKGCLIGPLNT